MSDVAGTEKFYDSIQQDVIVVFDERIKSTQLFWVQCTDLFFDFRFGL